MILLRNLELEKSQQGNTVENQPLAVLDVI